MVDRYFHLLIFILQYLQWIWISNLLIGLIRIENSSFILVFLVLSRFPKFYFLFYIVGNGGIWVNTFQPEEFDFVPFPKIFLMKFVRLLHILLKEIKELVRCNTSFEKCNHFIFCNRTYNKFLKFILFMFYLNKRFKNWFNHLIVIWIGWLDLSIHFKICFNNYFAFKISSL